MKMKMENNYCTKDLSEAALLYVNHFKLLKLVKEKNFYWFVFADATKAEELSVLFWSREVRVNAKAYAEAIRCLKEMIFSKRY